MAEDIFDKIIEGKIPSYKVYEDDDVLAFLDISQATPGHTLLVSKKHIDNIYDYDDESAKKVLTKIPIIARAIRKSNPKIIGLNILNNNGQAAGQSVIHTHWHFIPRYQDDKLDFPPTVDNSDKYDEEKYRKIAESIKKQF
ncbi:HIT family protein [Oenococcus alcoholitolerans]